MPTTKKTTKTKKAKLSFAPKTVTKRLIGVLPDRAQDVVIRRYGLGKDTKIMTLEAIGQTYGITRERVRQIENYALSTIRKSELFEKETPVFEELERIMSDLGGVVPEEIFLDEISKEKGVQNHVHFLLVLGHSFVREKENEHFTHRWHVDKEIATQVEGALKNLYKNLSDEELLSEKDVVKSFLEHLKDVASEFRQEEILKRWLSLSKKIDSNPLNQWGPSNASGIALRGIKDFAHVVISENGSPMHFAEVAKEITKLFGKKAHQATTHNELIKDKRFVLVGRGLYALTEWGYLEGVVKDVITAVLEQHGALTRDEIVEKVLKERYVKKNTIAVNLQDQKKFKKLDDGRYELA